jgi:hypothetical protein
MEGLEESKSRPAFILASLSTLARSELRQRRALAFIFEAVSTHPAGWSHVVEIDTNLSLKYIERRRTL